MVRIPSGTFTRLATACRGFIGKAAVDGAKVVGEQAPNFAVKAEVPIVQGDVFVRKAFTPTSRARVLKPLDMDAILPNLNSFTKPLPRVEDKLLTAGDRVGLISKLKSRGYTDRQIAELLVKRGSQGEIRHYADAMIGYPESTKIHDELYKIMGEKANHLKQVYKEATGKKVATLVERLSRQDATFSVSKNGKNTLINATIPAKFGDNPRNVEYTVDSVGDVVKAVRAKDVNRGELVDHVVQHGFDGKVKYSLMQNPDGSTVKRAIEIPAVDAKGNKTGVSSVETITEGGISKVTGLPLLQRRQNEYIDFSHLTTNGKPTHTKYATEYNKVEGGMLDNIIYDVPAGFNSGKTFETARAKFNSGAKSLNELIIPRVPLAEKASEVIGKKPFMHDQRIYDYVQILPSDRTARRGAENIWNPFLETNR